MTLSAEFSVDGDSTVSEHTCAYGATVALAALSLEFRDIAWEIASSSKSGTVAPTLVLAGTPLGATASFVQVADPGDRLGRAWVVKCTQHDAQGNAAVAYRVVGTLNVNGRLPVCADEERYRNATHGWAESFNEAIADSASGTETTASFVQPAINSNVSVAVLSSSGMAEGSTLYIEGGGYYQLVTVDDLTHITVENLGYSANATPASTVATAAQVSPAGVAGDPGTDGADGTRRVAFVVTSNEAFTSSLPVGAAARDGYTPVSGDIGFWVGQTTQAQNGPFQYNGSVWARPTWYDDDGDVKTGIFFQVLNGTTGAGTVWRQISGSTIAGSKLFTRDDTTDHYDGDLALGPYLLNTALDSGATQASKVNSAIAAAGAAGGYRTIRLPKQLTPGSPIIVKGCSGVILQGPPGDCEIAPTFACGPALYFGGWVAAQSLTPYSSFLCSTSDDFSLICGVGSPYIDLTYSGIWISANDGGGLPQFSVRDQCGRFTSLAGGSHIVSCAGRALVDHPTSLYLANDRSICFQISISTTGQVIGKLRAGNTLYTVTTAAGTIAADSSSLYDLRLEYDGAKVRIFATKQGSTSCSATLGDGSDASAGVRGYAETAATGTVLQMPWERTQYGSAHQASMVDGLNGVSLNPPAGLLGRLLIGAKALTTSGTYAAPTTGLSISGGSGATNKDFAFIRFITAGKLCDGEIIQGSIGDPGDSSGTVSLPTNSLAFYVLRGGGAGAANTFCGALDVRVTHANLVTSGITGAFITNSIGTKLRMSSESVYIGATLFNNSYESHLDFGQMVGNSRSFASVIIGSGLATVRNHSRAFKSRWFSGIWYGDGTWGGTSFTDVESYCHFHITPGTSTRFSGFGITEEANSQPLGLCGIYLDTAADVPAVCHLDGSFNYYRSYAGPVGSQPFMVNNASGNAKVQFVIGGLLNNAVNDATHPLIKFTAAPGNTLPVIIDAKVMIDETYVLTNYPGKVILRDRPIATVALTGQTGSHPAADLFGTNPVAGLYQVQASLAVTTADAGAGTVKLRLSYVDPLLGARDVDSSAVALTTTGRYDFSFRVPHNGGALKWQTIVATAGTSAHAINIAADITPGVAA